MLVKGATGHSMLKYEIIMFACLDRIRWPFNVIAVAAFTHMV